MSDQRIIRFHDMKNPRLAALPLFAFLAAVAFFACLVVGGADRKMRADLLQQTRLVAQAVEIKRVLALSATETDLDNPHYLQLKEKLAAVRSANPQCRFVYLMGRRADGTVFFFVDSEPASSKDYSPPGQVYDEVPAGFRRVFDTRTTAVEGPVTDRWGTWVSALVPLIDPQNGAVVAVLAMDIDARDWKWTVAANAALPVGLILLLFIGVAAIYFSDRRVDASPKPVLRHLLPSLTAMVILLIIGALSLLWQQQQNQLAGEVSANISDVYSELSVALDQQAFGMAMAVQPIAANTDVQQALREGNPDRLLASWRPVFETLQRENHLTHFYFFDANRVCLLRVHKPELYGDFINRFTALNAERTGKTASGIELGPLGTFTLRVVQPVFEGSRLVGYVELGKEIEDVLQSMYIRSGNQLAVTIRKEHLNRQKWEEGMRMLGREADWDRLPHSAIIYASQGRLPDAFLPIAYRNTAGDQPNGETGREIAFDGKDWRASAMPLPDASGAVVGDLLILRDITVKKAAFARLLVLGGTAGAVLLALLLGFIYVLLRRTDRGISAQQAALRLSSERLQLATHAAHIGIWDWDVVKNELAWDDSMYRLYGIQREDFGGAYDAWVRTLHPEDKARTEGEIQAALRGEREYAPEFRIIWPDGSIRNIKADSQTFRDRDGKPLRMIGTNIDVTERKQAEEALRQSEQSQALNAQRTQTLLQLNQMVEATQQEITDFALEEAVRLTQSKIGYLAFLNEDESILTMHSWSKSAMAECAIDQKPIEYPVVSTGLWGEAVRQRRPIITNDYAALNPWKKGYPQGHVAVKRHMNVPVFDGSRIVIVAGVGNKDEEYEQGDAQQLTLLMEGMWRLVERKRAEEKLRESEFRFRSFFDSNPEGVILMDFDGKIIAANKALGKMSGSSIQEIVNRDFKEFVPAAYHDIAQSAIRSIKAGMQPKEPAEMVYLAKNGGEIPIAVKGWYITDENSNPVSLGVFVRDLTSPFKVTKEH